MTANGNGVCTFDDATHTYRIDGVIVPSVTQVLRLGGLELSFPNVPESIREAAREKGSAVHEACDFFDEEKLDWDHLREKATMLVPYMEAWKDFRFVYPMRKDETAEEIVWSKALGVAGKLDRRCGDEIIRDIKTSKRLSWTMGVQLAGYVALYLHGTEGVALGDPLRRAFVNVKREVVQLCDDGTYHVERYDDPDDLMLFTAALTITRAKLAHSPRMKLPAEETEG